MEDCLRVLMRCNVLIIEVKQLIPKSTLNLLKEIDLKVDAGCGGSTSRKKFNPDPVCTR